MKNPVRLSSCVTPAGRSNELDVQNEWEENTHTHTSALEKTSVLSRTKYDILRRKTANKDESEKKKIHAERNLDHLGLLLPTHVKRYQQ